MTTASPTATASIARAAASSFFCRALGRATRPVAGAAAVLVLASSASGQLPRIMLVGYWPPTNEMLRQFSQSTTQNPSGWRGGNWQGLGYDVVSFFPEFPGGQSSNPKGNGDFEVDYQDTSADFWRITEQVRPTAIITFSRGRAGSNWEIEAGARNLQTWANDYVAPFQPTPSPPDASVPAGFVRRSTLPMTAIEAAVDRAGLGIDAFIDNTNVVGGFLSEYLAYHGMWYQSIHSNPADPYRMLAAGHVHVGISTPVAQAALATEITLREVIRAIPAPGGVAMLALAGVVAARRRRG